MSNIFPNKNPKLFGSGEDSIGIIDQSAIAGLIGDLIMSKVLDSGQQQFNATVQSQQVFSRAQISAGSGVAKITFSNILTPTEKSTLVIVVASATFIPVSGTSTKPWLLKRDTTQIDSFSLQSADNNSTNADIRIFVDVNPTAGTHTYTLVENNANTFGGITAQLFFIQGTDTHAAEITTPATATKQINSPDSHRTQQTEVIP